MRFLFLLVILFPFIPQRASAAGSTDTLFILIAPGFTADHPVPEKRWKERFVERLKIKYGENNKTIAAILSFPLPFGFVGLHRIYLGTKPYVPVVYIATLGGCAGILPLIDFFAILTANKETFEGFKNNPRVFMWAR